MKMAIPFLRGGGGGRGREGMSEGEVKTLGEAPLTTKDSKIRRIP